MKIKLPETTQARVVAAIALGFLAALVGGVYLSIRLSYSSGKILVVSEQLE